VHSSLEETRQLIYTTTPTDIDPWRKVYAIVLRPEATEQKSDPCLSVKSESPRMIGVLGTPREFELAYKIHSDFWGKGYMSEALEAYIDLFWKGERTKNPRKCASYNLSCRESRRKCPSSIYRSRKYSQRSCCSKSWLQE